MLGDINLKALIIAYHAVPGRPSQVDPWFTLA
jgi:hypothetical protein